MSDTTLTILFSLLCLLLLLSALFAGSETGMMSINRYRLRHRAKSGDAAAKRVLKLLERPDRLISIILIGNNFVNILSASIATLIAVHLWGDVGVLPATLVLTLIILVFSEVAPKTLAALHPERFAFPASRPLQSLLKILYPLVWVVNNLSNGLLRIFGIHAHKPRKHHLSQEELRMVMHEAGTIIPQRHLNMLLGLLDLEKVTVNDIMVPRTDIVGIDLNSEWDDIIGQLTHSQYTILPVYRESIEHVEGTLLTRHALQLHARGKLNADSLGSLISEPYFIPESTPLHTQLLNFQRNKRRLGLLVDEYGEIDGLVTLEDILEEVVGEFTTDPAETRRGIHAQLDGSYLVEGSTNVRELNRIMDWKFPIKGPKTLNGLITEALEAMPKTGISLKIAGYPIEIMQVKDNAVKIARVKPK